MEIQNLKVSELEPYFNNPRKNDNAVLKMAESIQTFGFQNPIIADTKKVIIAGHTRWKAALKLNLKTVPVIITDLPEEKAKAYRIADNRIGEFADWDWKQLQIELDSMDEDIQKLLDFEIPAGFGITEGLIDDDDVPEVEEAICKFGDIWKLGKHRLLCGDATNTDEVEKLMDGQKADMMFIDPPYGVDYNSKNEFLNKWDKGNSNQTPIENDAIEDYDSFFGGVLSIIKNNLSDYNSIYVTISGQKLSQLLNQFKINNIKMSQILIWVKNNHVLGRQDYSNKHELIIYGWNGRHKYYGEFCTTIWEIDRPLKSELHPTMKPVELIIKAINNSSKKDMIVYDCFLGSGSTLIACEKTNRKCYGMEIDPHYCDVVIKRWEEYTGNKAELINA